MRYISHGIVKRKYTELSIHANIYLSIFNIVSVLHWLNYSVKVSVERWPHCHVRYCFTISFAIGPSNFANNVFVHFFKKKIALLTSFILAAIVFTSTDRNTSDKDGIILNKAWGLLTAKSVNVLMYQFEISGVCLQSYGVQTPLGASKNPGIKSWR